MPKPKTEEYNEEAEITIRLMGRSAEPLRGTSPMGERRSADVRMKLPANKPITLRNLIRKIADENPLLKDQIVRGDGTPRSSTRILLNGKPPEDLDATLEVREDAQRRRTIVVILGDGTVIVITDVVIIVFLPCDG